MYQLKKTSKIICIILFLLSLAIALTINAKWLYRIDINRLTILDNTILSKNELMHNYNQLMNYLNFFWVNPLKMTDFPVSANGALHFYEVKRLFQVDYVVLLITSIPSFLVLKKSYKEGTLWQLIRPFSYVLVGLITLLIFMAAAFDTFFVKFHELFFNNDAWVFDPYTDPVINVLPQDYFMHCFMLFFVFFVFFLVLIIIMGKKQLKTLRKS